MHAATKLPAVPGAIGESPEPKPKDIKESSFLRFILFSRNDHTHLEFLLQHLDCLLPQPSFLVSFFL